MPSDRRPRLIARQLLPRVVGAERARRRDRDGDLRVVARVEQDRVQAHPACSGLPRRAGAVAAQGRQLLPGGAAVDRAEQRGVLHTGEDRVRVVERRLEVPHPGELPGHRRAVEELVGARVALVDELVAHRVPGAPAVVAALDQLAEPAAALRDVDPIGIRGGALDVVDLPAREVRPARSPSPCATRPRSGRTRPSVCRPVPAPQSSRRPPPGARAALCDGRPRRTVELIDVGSVPFIHPGAASVESDPLIHRSGPRRRARRPGRYRPAAHL